MRVLLLHHTQHDVPAVELVLAAQGYVVRSVAVNALTLQAEGERWNPEIILIAADDAARDVVEQICVNSQFRERAIVVLTEDDDPVALRAAMQARVSAYVVAGMQPKRLRSVIDVALERFKQDQLQLAQIDAARRAVDSEQARERTLARAKALLRRRGMSEPDAYAALRSLRCASAVRWLKWPNVCSLVHSSRRKRTCCVDLVRSRAYSPTTTRWHDSRYRARVILNGDHHSLSSSNNSLLLEQRGS